MSERECKYPLCFYHTETANRYCTNACYCDHQDYDALNIDNTKEVNHHEMSEL